MNSNKISSGKPPKYVLVKYIRLSMDDVITDSLSIPNQRRLLDKYIEAMEIPDAQVIEFVDNGHTGTNFERPAVQELLELVQSGGVDCIVCKDYSRFGRNSVDMEYFLEKVFPLYQTRFISIDEHHDSDDYKGDTGGIDVAFRYLAHEQYSRDLSHKVKSAKRIQMLRGENIVANAIYGYLKGDSGRWEPDGDAADVVRKIFKLALAGLSTAKIRDTLFSDGIPTPSEYHAMKRDTDTIMPSCLWTARMVMHILSNEQYTGMYVSGKQISKAVGSHSKIHTDKSEWIMIPDNHQPIVSVEDFAAVQELLNRYRNSTTTKPIGNLLMEDENRPRRDRMISGERLPNNPIYGYIKEKSGYLIADPTAAYIIHEIYELAAQGLSIREIRDRFTEAGYLTPSEHIKLGRGQNITPECRWTDKSIRNILQNMQYTGAYVSGKILKNYETGKKYHTAKSDWVIIPGNHPAIVSKELYDTVQAIIVDGRVKRKNMKPREYLLRGKVACGCCHYALSYDPVSDPVFRCTHTQADPSADCHKMKVSARELDEAVLAIIEKQIQVVLGCGISDVHKINEREKQIADYERQIGTQEEQRQRIYEQFVEQEIDRETYMTLKGVCGTRLDKLSQQLTMLKAEEHTERINNNMVSKARDLMDRAATPRELVETLVKKIYVFPDDRVEIEWLISDFTMQT